MWGFPEPWFSLTVSLIFNIGVAELFRRWGPHPQALGYVIARVGKHYTREEAPGIHRKLELRYNGQLLRNLDIFTVAIWNGHPTGIDGSALATRDPLRLELKGGRILDAEIIQEVDSQSGFAILTQENTITVSFDYARKGDGIKLDVYAAPPNAEDSKLVVVGTVKNTKLIQWPAPNDPFPLKRYKKPILGALILSLGLAGAAYLASFLVGEPLKDSLKTFAWLTFFFWQVLAWIPLDVAEGYFRLGFHVPRRLRY